MAKAKKRRKGDSSPQQKKTERRSISQTVDDILERRWVSSVFLAVLFLIALIVRLSYLKYYQSPLTGDAAIYAKIAWGIKNGYGLHWWSVVWSPFYPFITVIFSVFSGSLESATWLVSLILGSLTVVPFFFLAKNMFNHRAAYLGSFLVVFSPAVIVISEVPLSEATYAFFLLTTLLCGWSLIRKRSYLYASLFGLASGICYLTRPEFLVAFAALFLTFIVIEARRKTTQKPGSLVLALVCMIAFLIPAFYYMNFMHSQTGHWILSGKTAHNILKQEAYAKGADYSGQREALAQVLDGLTPEGEVKGKVLLGKESMFSFLRTPGFFGSYFKNLWLGIRKMNLFFLPFLLFSLFYIFSWKTEKRGWQKRLFLLLSFCPILTMPIFFAPAGRLIEPYAPILILMTVAGMLNLEALVAKPRGDRRPDRKGAAGFYAAVLLVGLLSVFSVAQAGRTAENHERVFQATKRGSEEFKSLGQWADRTLPKDASVMCLSWDTFFFYCNRRTFTVPFAPWEEVIRFAKANRIDHLLVSVSLQASWRDDLTFLLEPLRDRSKTPPDSNLRLLEIYHPPSGMGAVLYKFQF